MALNKISNEYADAFGRLYTNTPKSVFAALAYSYISRCAGPDGETDSRELIVQEFLREWAILHENGIVPQKPPKAATA